MRLLGVVLCAFVFAVPANAAYPGTHEEPRLEAAASYVAGKPVSVYCGDNTNAWASFIASLNGPLGAEGYAVYGGTEAYIAPTVCTTLLDATSDPRVLGPAVLTLAHEAIHLRGVRDESETDCAALRKVRHVAWIYFGVHPWDFWRLSHAAWAAHRRKPPQYRTTC